MAIRKEREEWEKERATERGQKSLETARRQIQDDPTLRIRDDEIAAVARAKSTARLQAGEAYLELERLGRGRGRGAELPAPLR